MTLALKKKENNAIPEVFRLTHFPDSKVTLVLLLKNNNNNKIINFKLFKEFASPKSLKKKQSF